MKSIKLIQKIKNNFLLPINEENRQIEIVNNKFFAKNTFLLLKISRKDVTKNVGRLLHFFHFIIGNQAKVLDCKSFPFSNFEIGETKCQKLKNIKFSS